jgi:hypothetical protein
MMSQKNANVIVVDEDVAILEKIAKLDLSEWNFVGGKRPQLASLRQQLKSKSKEMSGFCWLYSIPDNRAVQYQF